MTYRVYISRCGSYVIVRHDKNRCPQHCIAWFPLADKATADAVCRDLNRAVSCA